MKKVALLLCLILCVFLLVSCSGGNKTTEADAPANVVVAEENVSQFEQILLKKGDLIVKEFIDCGYFEKDSYIDYSTSNKLFGFTDALKFQSASILDVETGAKVYALRVTTGYYKSEYNYGEAVGVMDADQIDGAIKTLQYIKEHLPELKDYSEVIYTANSGMQVGAYHSSTGDKIFVKVNSDATKFYDTSKIDSLISAFEKVKSTLGDKPAATETKAE